MHLTTPFLSSRSPSALAPLSLAVRSLMIALLTALLVGCDLGLPSSEGEAELSRDQFVETYVELRVAAAGWEGAQLPEEERDRILAEQQISADQLREFVHVHGRNVPFMNGIWNEVSERVSARLDPPDLDEEGGDPLTPGQVEG